MRSLKVTRGILFCINAGMALRDASDACRQHGNIEKGRRQYNTCPYGCHRRFPTRCLRHGGGLLESSIILPQPYLPAAITCPYGLVSSPSTCVLRCLWGARRFINKLISMIDRPDASPVSQPPDIAPGILRHGVIIEQHAVRPDLVQHTFQLDPVDVGMTGR